VKFKAIRTLAVAVAAAIGVMYAAAPAMAQEKTHGLVGQGLL